MLERESGHEGDQITQNGLSVAVAAAGAFGPGAALPERLAFVVFFEVAGATACGSFVSTCESKSRPFSTLCVNRLMKL